MAKQIAKGTANFNFGAGPFGFGAGNMGGGFRYYEYRTDGTGFDPASEEREVYESNVLDVTPLKIVHEKKDDSEGSDDSKS